MTYMGGPYYPWWLDNLADDVTGDGAAFQGAAQGAEAVRAIVLAARELYEHQDFSFIGDYDERFLEEYTCQIRGELAGLTHHHDNGSPNTPSSHQWWRLRHRGSDAVGALMGLSCGWMLSLEPPAG
jgi:hypothetical protein